MAMQIQAEAAQSHKKIYQHLYVQVLCAITIGVLLGHFYPSRGRTDEATRRHVHPGD